MDAPCVIVACICLEKLASAEVSSSGIASYTKVVRICIGLKRSGHDAVVGFCTGYVQTCTHIEAEGFESMYLIVRSDPAYESSGQGEAEVVI